MLYDSYLVVILDGEGGVFFLTFRVRTDFAKTTKIALHATDRKTCSSSRPPNIINKFNGPAIKTGWIHRKSRTWEEIRFATILLYRVINAPSKCDIIRRETISACRNRLLLIASSGFAAKRVQGQTDECNKTLY